LRGVPRFFRAKAFGRILGEGRGEDRRSNSRRGCYGVSRKPGATATRSSERSSRLCPLKMPCLASG
jgi:hypothetical protein